MIAPFDGVIARLNIREGDYWTPQIVNVTGDYQGIVARLPIIIIDPSQFEVNVELPAFQGGQIRSGQRAFVILDRDRQPHVFVVNEHFASFAVDCGWIDEGIDDGERRRPRY